MDYWYYVRCYLILACMTTTKLIYMNKFSGRMLADCGLKLECDTCDDERVCSLLVIHYTTQYIARLGLTWQRVRTEYSAVHVCVVPVRYL